MRTSWPPIVVAVVLSILLNVTVGLSLLGAIGLGALLGWAWAIRQVKA